MRWAADASPGSWIRDALDPEPWTGSMHAVVPRGFPAHARIFHRPQVSWVDGRPFPTQDELRESDPSTWPETHGAATTWRETAAAFGTELHPTAQWNRIVRTTDVLDDNGLPRSRDWQHVIGPDGREYSAPAVGTLDAEQLAAVAGRLAAATSTPEQTWIAVWEGWGGIVGFYGDTPARVTLSAVDDAGLFARHTAMLERSIHDPFNNVFRKPTWQPGLLDDEISRGGRLSLPQRDHVLFAGDIRELADPAWTETVPWAEADAGWTQSPSLVWPEDRAWVLVTEVDFDSTIVGGSAELVRSICADPTLEALPLPEGADLTWDADEVNR